MENAQLISLSRQVALQRQMDVVANNMANINTTGFKGEKSLFEEYIMLNARDESFPLRDQRVSFTQDWATMHDLAEGPLKMTGNDLDLALQGSGFLSVETPQGTRYTRNGALQIDAQGILVTSEGNPVMGGTGQIRFEPSETDITFTADGTVLSSAGNKGKLEIAEFANPQALTREGSGLYAADANTPALPPTDTRLVQGSLEGSNVSAIKEMANMISVNRAYQTMAQMMDRTDQLRRTAIQRLGDLNA